MQLRPKDTIYHCGRGEKQDRPAANAVLPYVRALPSVEHFVSCHPDSTLLQVLQVHKCSPILYIV
jgi:hypothetical protein